jgi:hypothetical protein
VGKEYLTKSGVPAAKLIDRSGHSSK